LGSGIRAFAAQLAINAHRPVETFAHIAEPTTHRVCRVVDTVLIDQEAVDTPHEGYDRLLL
jgi:hypothetical protein